MVDSELIKKYKETNDFDLEKLLLVFEIVKQVMKENEEIREDMKGIPDLRIQFVVSDKNFAYYLAFIKGELSYGKGRLYGVDITVTADHETYVNIGNKEGRKDAIFSAYVEGKLKYDGNLNAILSYVDILNVFEDEIEEILENH